MTPDCTQARRILAPSPGHHEPVPEAASAEDHVQNCPACRDFFAQHANVAARAHEAGSKISSPPRLRSVVIRTLFGSAVTAGPRRNIWLGGLAIAATAVIALALGPPALVDTSMSAQPFVTQALAPPSAGEVMQTSATGPLEAWFASNALNGFEIPEVEDARMHRGRLARVGGRLSAAVDYEMEGGVPFTYIEVPETEIFQGITDSDILTMSSDGWQVAMWAENGRALAVISTMDSERLITIAEECRRKNAL